MKKELEVGPALFPMPVLMIATYSDDNKVDVMTMAWGGICDTEMVSLNISEDHRTADNIKKRRAFTISVADVPHIAAADFLGTVSANEMSDKFKRSGLTAIPSSKVNAPIIEEFPVTLECKVAEIKHESYGFHVLGKIVSVLADETVLDENGKVNAKKLNAFVFDQYQNNYYAIGEKLGQAWNIGMSLAKSTD